MRVMPQGRAHHMCREPTATAASAPGAVMVRVSESVSECLSGDDSEGEG